MQVYTHTQQSEPKFRPELEPYSLPTSITLQLLKLRENGETCTAWSFTVCYVGGQNKEHEIGKVTHTRQIKYEHTKLTGKSEKICNKTGTQIWKERSKRARRQ
jgi:hypothetical protein